MKLVDDWKSAWRWHSTQALAVLAALPAVWATIPADLKATIPEQCLPYALIAVAVGGLVGRVRDQG